MGDRIKESRKKRGLSQQDLADFLGKGDRSSVSYFESGKSSPSIDELLLMSLKFKVSLPWLAAIDVVIESGVLNLSHDDVAPVVQEITDIEYQVEEILGTQLPKDAHLEDLRSAKKHIESFLKAFDG